MEKNYSIKTSDGFEIDGVLNWKEESDILIIFCHGFQWSFNRHIFHNGAKYFAEKWFHCFRFDFYNGSLKTRKLHMCDFDVHGWDIDSVVQFFRDDYKEIILIWHSFGGLSILYSSQNVEKIVLWDPSLVLKEEQKWANEKEVIYDEEKKLCYFADTLVYINPKMLSQHSDESREKAYNFLVPWYIICAEGCYLYENWIQIYKGIEHCTWIYNVLGANHSFDQEGKEEELFEKTLEFINT